MLPYLLAGPVTSTYTARRYPFSILPFGVTAARAAVGGGHLHRIPKRKSVVVVLTPAMTSKFFSLAYSVMRCPHSVACRIMDFTQSHNPLFFSY